MNKKVLFSILGAAILALVAFRVFVGPASNEVVIEQPAEMNEVRQMMNDLVQQQQQQPGAPGSVPGP